MLRLFADHGLTPDKLQASYRRQLGMLHERFDALDLPDELVTRDRETPLERFGGFLAVGTPHAAALQRALHDRGVMCDRRGRYLRLGPAPYVTDAQLEAAVAALGEAARNETRLPA